MTLPDGERSLLPYKWRTYLLGAFVTIVLGAIGSGLWELFLKNVFDFIGRNILKFWQIFFSADKIYKKIGRGNFDYFGLLPFAISCSIFIVGPWLYTIILNRKINNLNQIITGKNKYADEEKLIRQGEFIIKWKKQIITFFFISSLFSTLAYSSVIYEAAYITRAITWIEQSIDILAPHIGTDNTIRLRAMYRSVDNTRSFYALEDNINNIAKEKKVKLPDFKSIR